MSEQKCISTNETNPRRASSTKSPSKKEPVIEGPTFSYYRCVACAVAITAVVLGVFYLYLKTESSSPHGLVFYRETIFSKRVITDRGEGCLDAVGGKDRADMLKKQIKRISGTKKIFVIEEDPQPVKDISETEKFIMKCMQDLGLPKEFKNVYVWEYKYNERLSRINEVIKKTGLDNANLQFICKLGHIGGFLKDNKFNVFEVVDKIYESDFEQMISTLNIETIQHV